MIQSPMTKFTMVFNGKSFLYILLLFLIFFVLGYMRDIFATFGISLLLAYLLDPLVNFMEKVKIRRKISIITIFLIFSLAVTFLLIFILPLIYGEILKIVAELPKYILIISSKLEKISYAMDIKLDIGTLKSFLTQKAGSISKVILSASADLTSSLYELVKYALNLMLIPILVFYFLKDFETIKENLFGIIRGRISGFNIDEAFMEFNQIIKTYFRGQLLVSLFLAIAYTTVLLVVGIEGAVTIGIISGALSIVPYLGFLTGFITSLFISYLQFNDLLHPFYILIGFSIVQFIESNFVTPKIIGESLGLHPTAVIFALMTGGYLLGVGGMIFSLPLAAFIKVFFIKKLKR